MALLQSLNKENNIVILFSRWCQKLFDNQTPALTKCEKNVPRIPLFPQNQPGLYSLGPSVI